MPGFTHIGHHAHISVGPLQAANTLTAYQIRLEGEGRCWALCVFQRPMVLSLSSNGILRLGARCVQSR